MRIPASVQARISRILQRFNDDATPELRDFISGVVSDETADAIDDGARYDPQAHADRPDFVKEHLDGWQ